MVTEEVEHEVNDILAILREHDGGPINLRELTWKINPQRTPDINPLWSADYALALTFLMSSGQVELSADHEVTLHRSQPSARGHRICPGCKCVGRLATCHCDDDIYDADCFKKRRHDHSPVTLV